jgi:hypothetical protein
MVQEAGGYKVGTVEERGWVDDVRAGVDIQTTSWKNAEVLCTMYFMSNFTLS